jgi:hypothetical protein
MLQLSQSKDTLLLAGSFIFLVAIFVPTFLWMMRRTINNIQLSSQFTDQEVTAVQSQMIALLVDVSLVLLFFALARLIENQPTPYTIIIGLVLGFSPIAYIAVSSIRNRVSIFGGRKGIPVQGTKAIWSGVLNLVLIILVVIAYIIWL